MFYHRCYIGRVSRLAEMKNIKCDYVACDHVIIQLDYKL